MDVLQRPEDIHPLLSVQTSWDVNAIDISGVGVPSRGGKQGWGGASVS